MTHNEKTLMQFMQWQESFDRKMNILESDAALAATLQNEKAKQEQISNDGMTEHFKEFLKDRTATTGQVSTQPIDDKSLSPEFQQFLNERKK